MSHFQQSRGGGALTLRGRSRRGPVARYFLQDPPAQDDAPLQDQETGEMQACDLPVAPPAATAIETEIRELADQTAAILRVAHAQAEELLSRATAEAETMLAAARSEAESITSSAERRLRELDRETDQLWAERTRLTDDTLRVAQALRSLADGAAARFPPAQEEEAPVASAERRPVSPAEPASAAQDW